MRAAAKVAASVAAILLGGLVPIVDVGRSDARQDPPAARSARGGALARTAHYQFEAFCYPSGLRIFVADPAGKALDASRLRGTATFYHPDSPSPWFTRPLRPSPAQPGHPAESLDLAMDLRSVPSPGAIVSLEIAGLPDRAEAAATFALPFVPVGSQPAASPAGGGEIPVHGEAFSTDQVRYYSSAGFYQTASGVMIWIPAPGYYHDIAVQFYPHGMLSAAAGWQPAHPASAPSRPVTARASGAPETIQTEFYWRPKAFANPADYHSWIQAQMRQEQAAGRSPSLNDRECARCHRR